jgi:hypothetical protein
VVAGVVPALPGSGGAGLSGYVAVEEGAAGAGEAGVAAGGSGVFTHLRKSPLTCVAITLPVPTK